MVQFNTEAIVPHFISTKGYGLLWDNSAWTYLNGAEGMDMVTIPLLNISGDTARYTASQTGRHFVYFSTQSLYGVGGSMDYLQVNVTASDGTVSLRPVWYHGVYFRPTSPAAFSQRGKVSSFSTIYGPSCAPS